MRARLIVGLAFAGLVLAQAPEPAPSPAPPVEQAEPQEAQKPPEEPPFWKRIDWSNRSNQLMLALLIGAIIIAKVAFRKMQD